MTDPPWTIRSRAPRGDAAELLVREDPEVIGSLLEDAAHFPGGHAAGLIVAASEAAVARAMSLGNTLLPVGAQSSLTGGATPRGELLISTRRLNRVIDVGRDRVRVEAGVTLSELQEAIVPFDRYYPPAPTYAGATIGGTAATNAAGAETFKYGTTRDWVQAMTVVLPTGDVLDIERGETRAGPEGYFEIVLPERTIRVPAPTYARPAVPKVAGYYAAPGMDLIDLFIGAEGTLGIVTDVTVRVLPSRPAQCLAFIPFRDRAGALAFVSRVRQQAINTWHGNHGGFDVSAVEHMDRRCLELLRADHVDRATHVGWPADAEMALLVVLELPRGFSADHAYEEIGRARDHDAPDTPLVRFCRVLEDAGVLDDVEVAVPGDRRRAEQLHLLREAVPVAVNERVGLAKVTVDGRIEKTAADMIVPFDAFAGLLDLFENEFARRGLDVAIWGHISDGNVHPNVLPRSFEDVAAGQEAILAIGREVIRLGGSPVAEHGVGRNPVKQRLLRELYGTEGIEQMRRVKRAIDPAWKLAPGVLFPERDPA